MRLLPNLSYTTTAASYILNQSISSNTASSDGGEVSSFSISPTLAAGLSFDTATGEISGIPTLMDTTGVSYTVTAMNPAGSVSTIISIIVNDAPPNSLSYSTSPASYVRYSAITNNSPTTIGGAVLSYSISPALPSGLNFDTTTGVISGTPDAYDEAGTTYNISATNSGGSSSVTLVISVNPPEDAWSGDGANNNWSNADNWEGGVVPSSTDTVILDESCSPNCDIDVDIDVTIAALLAKPSYSGTLTQLSGNNMRVGLFGISTNRGEFRWESGTFVGSGSISDSFTADYLKLRGGSFTAPAGDLIISDTNATYSALEVFDLEPSASFFHNNGTLTIRGQGGSVGNRNHHSLTLNDDLDVYNLVLEIESLTDLQWYRGFTYNNSRTVIDGTSARINVMGNFTIKNGFFDRGDIYLYGNNAHFECDDPSIRRYCSKPHVSVVNSEGWADACKAFLCRKLGSNLYI